MALEAIHFLEFLLFSRHVVFTIAKGLKFLGESVLHAANLDSTVIDWKIADSVISTVKQVVAPRIAYHYFRNVTVGAANPKLCPSPFANLCSFSASCDWRVGLKQFMLRLIRAGSLCHRFALSAITLS
jgi:hypothetical protein